ncbi:MAG: UDP-N-acetylmuramate:L-alanyl-gamma-D-glutamyl-meso-diaminopimelate ligase [Gammaproteobacteria bacterium]|nr:UDP-N-acetylmuramate:L-alanyl-gamma-D-glutamyl-meso-diaminopimelate ligase [Gammaproteobacteria bacterium]
MQIHILGICGTFMGGLALLARQLGYTVSGSDKNIFPPMSDQLANAGIEIIEGYSASQLNASMDSIIIIGNALSRGNECVEFILNEGLKYTSGPQWLAEHVLADRHVLAVAGTHGKTTTSSILAWILESAGKQPGFLIGGVAENFALSARLGDSELFVIEADEYDTAFFDKRSKFIHYRPKTLLINNIEFDHADIFADMGAIRREFHHMIRTLPAQGQIVFRQDDTEISRIIEMGCWTPRVSFGIGAGDWTAEPLADDYCRFCIKHNGEEVGQVEWDLIGKHNCENALAALTTAAQLGLEPADACRALTDFKSVKRRLQRLACVNDITVYDDFAHHPTAIETTLHGLRMNVGRQRIITILEPRSNTMKMGVHQDSLAQALSESDQVMLYQAENIKLDLNRISMEIGDKCRIYTQIEEIIQAAATQSRAGDHIVIMSNGAFDNIHQRLIERLQA